MGPSSKVIWTWMVVAIAVSGCASNSNKSKPLGGKGFLSALFGGKKETATMPTQGVLLPPSAYSGNSTNSQSSEYTRNYSAPRNDSFFPPEETNPIQRVSASVSEPSLFGSVKNAFTSTGQKVSDLVTKNDPKITPVTSDKKLDPTFHVDMARIQERKGDVKGAIDQYQRALKVDPKLMSARLGLGRLFDRAGKHQEATEHYLLAVKYHPKEAAPHNDLGLCYARQLKLRESKAELQQAVELRPDKPLYRNNLATVLVEMEEIDKAVEELTPAYGLPAAHYNVGFILNRRGKQKEALEEFEKALCADPNFQPAMHWVQALRNGQSPSAQMASRPAVRPAPAAPAPSVAVPSAPVAPSQVPQPQVQQPVAPVQAAPVVAPFVAPAPAAAPPTGMPSLPTTYIPPPAPAPVTTSPIATPPQPSREMAVAESLRSAPMAPPVNSVPPTPDQTNSNRGVPGNESLPTTIIKPLPPVQPRDRY